MKEKHLVNLFTLIITIFVLATRPLIQTTVGYPLSTLEDDSWPQVQKDANHSGYVAQTVTSPFIELWRRDLFPVSSRVQPIIAEGLIFLPSNDQYMYGLRTSDGGIAWSYKTDGALVNSAAYENGRVFFGSTDHYVYALRASDGAFIWKFETGNTVKTAPVLAEGRVFIGSSDGYFYALNQTDGSLAWSKPYFVGAPVYDTAAYNDGRVFFGGMDSIGYALNSNDGSLAWKQVIPGQGFRDRWTVAGNGKVFFTPMLLGSHSNALEDGTILFSESADPVIYNQPWSVQRQAILSHLASHPYQQPLFVLDQSSGQIAFTPPVLYASGGSQSPHSQPVLLPNGNANVIYRRSFGEPARWGSTTNDALYIGELNLVTGDIDPIDTCVPGSGGWNNCGNFKSAIISDESAALVRSGDVIYIDNSRGIMGLDLIHQATLPLVTFDPVSGGPYYNPPISILKSIDYERVESEVTSDGNDFKRPTPIVGNILYILYYNILVAVRGTLANYQEIPSAPPVTPSSSPLFKVTSNKDNSSGAGLMEFITLREELENQVQEWMDLGHLAPTCYYIGIGGKPLIFYTTPVEMLYTLSAAYPYLSFTLRNQVKQYLDSEIMIHPPHIQGHYFPSSGLIGDLVGTSREYYAVNEQQPFNFGPGADVHPVVLYAVWLFSNNTNDWSYAHSSYDEFKSIYINLRSTGEITSYPELSGVIGFSRIAQHLGQNSDYNDAINFINDHIGEASDFNQYLETAQMRFPEAPHSFTTPIFFFARSGINPAISTHFDRDIGYFLADHAVPAVIEYTNQINQRVPLWWLTAGAFSQGENAYTPPEISWTNFMLHAYVLEESADQLLSYLDAPIRKGDLYYIQKLIAIIEASGKLITKSASSQIANQGDVITYSLTIQDLSAPMTQTIPIVMNDWLPNGMFYNNGMCTSSWGASPVCWDTNIYWQGVLSNTIPVVITYTVDISTSQSENLINQMQVDGDNWGIYTRTYTIMVNPIQTYLPVIIR